MNRIRGKLATQLGSLNVDFSIDIPSSGACAIFGRSGAGKSTILRWMAGLNQSEKGNFSVNGEIWEDTTKGIFLPPEQRSVGYVFQENNLFPHLSAGQNIRYAYKRAPCVSSDSKIADEIFQMLGVSSLLEKKPFQLSGGEKQRVALARSLIMQPKLLLLDEPLSALDDFAKTEILSYLEKIKHQARVPMIFVSHSVSEVTRLCDNIIQIHDGRVIGTRPIFFDSQGLQ